MDKQLVRLFVFFALACGAAAAQVPSQTQQVQTYYVDAITPGNDANPGTAASPFATVNHVASIAPQGMARIFVKFPDLTWQQLQMPYLHLKLLFLGEQGTDANKIYDVANGDHATAHDVTWLTSPTPKAWVCDGSSSYATFTPVIGNSDFNIYIAAFNLSGTNYNYTEASASGSGAVVLGAYNVATSIIYVVDTGGSYGTQDGYSWDTIPANVPHVWAFGRQGAVLDSYNPDLFGAAVSPVTMSPNPTSTTTNGTLCAYSPGGSTGNYMGGSYGAIAVYNSYGSESDRSNRYTALKNLLTGINVQVDQPLDPALLSAGPIWVRQGVVFGNGVGGVTYAQEPSVIYEGNCHIVASSSCFKMWFSLGDASGGQMGYGESVTGLPGAWTAYSGNPVLSGGRFASVLKVGSTYYMFASKSDGSQMNSYTSSDGLSWSSLGTNILPLGAAGAVNSAGIWNSWVTYDGSLWKMLHDCSGTYPSESQYTICSATSSDGTTWAEGPRLPVHGFNPNLIGGAMFVYLDGRYWAWEQNFHDIFRITAQNFFGPWQLYPSTSTYPRGSTTDETDQTADPMMVELHQSCPGTSSTDCTYMFYGAVQGPGGLGINDVKLAVAPLTIRQIVQTTEGATTTTP